MFWYILVTRHALCDVLSGCSLCITGSVYALIHSIQSLVAFLGPVIHTAVFTATVKTFSSAVFIMSGSLLVVPLVLLG